MTVKQFFKSTTFKCLITLLCVLLVSGVFLTVMNALLKVTDEERFERAINKIYGKSVKTEVVTIENYNDNATIDEAYKVKDDGNYLIKATGKGGFDNGTVTCWVVVEIKNNRVDGIGKVVIDSHKAQSYIGNITDSFLNSFSTSYSGEYFNADNMIKTGATFSASAICNAVNGALDFANAKCGNVKEDIFANCLFTEYIDKDATTYTLVYDESDNTKVTGTLFHVVTKPYPEAKGFTIDITVDTAGKITAYKIADKGNGSTGGYDSKMNPVIKDGTLFIGKTIADLKTLLNDDMSYPKGGNDTLKTGATKSNYLCVYAAAFASANYDQFIPSVEDGGEENEGGQENE